MKIDKIILNANVDTIDELFSLVAKTLKNEGKIKDELKFIDALNKRESQSTTGMIDEIAIPHGQSDTVLESTVLYIRNQKGIEWESLDGSKVKHIFALAIKEGDGNHLDNLIAISSNLMDQDQRDILKRLDSEDDIINHFDKA